MRFQKYNKIKIRDENEPFDVYLKSFFDEEKNDYLSKLESLSLVDAI